MTWEAPHPDWYGPNRAQPERLTTLDGDDPPPCEKPCPHWSHCNQTGETCARFQRWASSGLDNAELDRIPQSDEQANDDDARARSRRPNNGNRTMASDELMQRAREADEAWGGTRSELAAAAGVSVATVRKLRIGRRLTPPMAERIAGVGV